jgi:hypothetical protein
VRHAHAGHRYLAVHRYLKVLLAVATFVPTAVAAVSVRELQFVIAV